MPQTIDNPIQSVVDDSITKAFDVLDNSVEYQTFLAMQQIANGTHPKFSKDPTAELKAKYYLWRGKLTQIVDVSQLSNGGSSRHGNVSRS